ncbi:hypothetical protein [Desulfosporosinus orientis]|uniref:hypothetical protein n=1 Tax=Desulfosporosinus orientis TaxID=1563 RepID=UPI001FA6B30D|nr:hypothetical protein [Desulfosporosinus orientis]
MMIEQQSGGWAMIYEVCALVLTIIFGVIGIELMLWFRSVRKLTDEAKKTVQDINAHLPYMLADVQAVTTLVKNTSEQVGGTVNEVAVSLENFRKNPLSFITVLIRNIKQIIELWHNIRGGKTKDTES